MSRRSMTWVLAKEARQALTLGICMVVNVFLGIAASVLNARLLGPDDYGKYRLLSSVLLLSASASQFGYYYSIGRLLAQEPLAGRRANLMGVGLLIVCAISAGSTILLLVFSCCVDDLFKSQLAHGLRLVAPFAVVLSSYLYLESVLQGDNRIYSLAASRTMPKVLYVAGAGMIASVYGLDMTTALLLVVGTEGLVYAIQFIRLRPAFRCLRACLREIQLENGRYGIHVYVGSIGAVAGSHAFGLLVGYFVNIEALGYYSLALTVSMPLAFVGSAVGTSYFKRFTGLEKIPLKVFATTLALGAVSLFGFLLFIRPVMLFLYSEEYRASIPLAYILAVGFVFHGLGDFFNRFLGAHGRGRELRNGALLVVVITLSLGVILASRLGAVGAAVAKSLASIIYCAVMMFFYAYRRRVAGDAE